jgi:hypothetical protein
MQPAHAATPDNAHGQRITRIGAHGAQFNVLRHCGKIEVRVEAGADENAWAPVVP